MTLDELDVEINFVKENEIVSRSSGSSAKLIHGIKVLMAKNVIDNLSEETRKGMLEKARSGIYPSFAGVGYRNVEGPDGKRIIVPDPPRRVSSRSYLRVSGLAGILSTSWWRSFVARA